MRRALAVLVVVAAACSGGDGDDDDAGGAATTTTEAPAETSSTSSSTTTAAAVPAGCDATIVPRSDDPPETIAGDIDGDGTQDEVLVTVDRADAWQLFVTLGGDRGAVTEQLPTVPTDHAEAVTTRDLDGDGAGELFVVVGNGASAQIYGIFTLDACDLEAVQFPGGTPAELPVGGSVVELHGLRCDAEGLTALKATSEDGVNYTTDERTYALADGVLTEVANNAGTLTPDAAQFPQYSQFSC